MRTPTLIDEIEDAKAALRAAETLFDEIDPVDTPWDLIDAAGLRVTAAEKHLNGLYVKAKEVALFGPDSHLQLQ